MGMDSGTWSARVAEVVRSEMARQRLTRRDLARALGVTGPTVTLRLDGHKPFNLSEIERVADWLGLALPDLLARADGLSPPHPSKGSQHGT